MLHGQLRVCILVWCSATEEAAEQSACVAHEEHEQAAASGPSGDSSGTTVVMLFIRGDELYVANLGDSRAVLSHRGVAVDLSEDQKPTLTKEQKRIEQEGGTVKYGYLNGDLGVSRAIGDFDHSAGCKPPGLSPTPEITRRRLLHDDEFVVLACDGLWDVMQSQDVVKSVRSDLIKDGNPQQAADRIVQAAIGPPKYSDDNTTAVVVSFMSEDVRRKLQADLPKKWVPRSRRVQMDALLLKDP